MPTSYCNMYSAPHAGFQANSNGMQRRSGNGNAFSGDEKKAMADAVRNAMSDGAARRDYDEAKRLVTHAVMVDPTFLCQVFTFSVQMHEGVLMDTDMTLMAFAVLQNNRFGNGFAEWIGSNFPQSSFMSPVAIGNCIDTLDAALLHNNRDWAATVCQPHLSRPINPNAPLRVRDYYAFKRLFRRYPRVDFLSCHAPKMFYYAYDGNKDAVESLTEGCHANAHAVDDNGRTVLHAIALGWADSVLCTDDGPFRARFEAENVRTAAWSHPHLWGYFVKRGGFDEEARDKDGKTADVLLVETLLDVHGESFASITWMHWYNAVKDF